MTNTTPSETQTDWILEARNLHKNFWLDDHRVDVLEGLDLQVKRGEMLAIVGASGAGKSTLLHILGTLDEPNRGELWMAGQNVLHFSEEELAAFRNKMIGFVFQAHYLLPEFSAVENVMMPALIHRIPSHTARAQAEELLDWVGLSHRIGHKPGELSGGERQRVALSRALVMRPPLLMADEPTGNLDQNTGDGIHKLLFDLNERWQTTLLIVTHNPTLAARMPRCLRLQEGKLVEVHDESNADTSND